jgi:hypothetical protein
MRVGGIFELTERKMEGVRGASSRTLIRGKRVLIVHRTSSSSPWHSLP